MKEKLNELKKLIENCEVDGYYGNTHDIQDALNKLTELEQLTIPVVGWRSEQLPDLDIKKVNDILIMCKENNEPLKTLISKIWNYGVLHGINMGTKKNN